VFAGVCGEQNYNFNMAHARDVFLRGKKYIACVSTTYHMSENNPGCV